MADSSCRAARQSNYEVRELGRNELSLALGLCHTCPDFLDALDFALEFLDEHDPLRQGAVEGLEIARVSESGRETVWTYRPGTDEAPNDLVRLWGFDVTAWQGPAQLQRR
jgi:hypothetical protein